jgi:uncharacterized protein
MKCPVCSSVDLLMSNRQGVEIDYCPNCRGVWLDRGELDKIIEREQGGSVRYQGEPPRTAPQPQYAQSHDQEYRSEHHGKHDEHGERYENRGHGHGYEQGHGKHKKKSLLGDLFDFG